MTQKRTKRIEIAVTDDEYQQLQNRKTKPRLAEWLRELGLGQSVVVRKKTDPDLIFALAKIGNNINQIARVCNSGNLDKNESIKILLALKQISEKLGEIKNDS